MKITKLFLLLFLLFFGFVSTANEINPKKITEKTERGPRFGKQREALNNYFTLHIEEGLVQGSFTRSIFRLRINIDGIVEKVEAINHPLQEKEEAIIGIIKKMQWNEMDSISSVYIIIEMGEGKINVSIR